MSDTGYRPEDRRPIAARGLQASQWAASWLAAHAVAPNTISVLGMVAGVAAGAAFALTANADGWQQRGLWIVGAVLVQVRLLANMLDGMVAIASQRASSVGELYNEVPDRVSDSAILIGAGYGASGYPLLGWGAALFALFTAYIRALGKASGAPQDYRGPMAKPHRMAVITTTALFCALTPSDWAARSELARASMAIALFLIVIGCGVTAGRRLLASARYLRGANATPKTDAAELRAKDSTDH